MQRKFIALIFIAVMSAISSIIVLIFVLDRINQDEAVNPAFWLLFSIQALIGMLSALRASNVDRKQRDEWYKDQ